MRGNLGRAAGKQDGGYAAVSANALHYLVQVITDYQAAAHQQVIHSGRCGQTGQLINFFFVNLIRINEYGKGLQPFTFFVL